MGRAKQLWAGEVPLAVAFWRYAILYGALVNVATSLLFAALYINGAPTPVLVAAYALPLPYNLFMCVAVWRCAGRYDGAEVIAEVARIGTIVLMAILCVT